MFLHNVLRIAAQVAVLTAVLLVPSKAWSCCPTMLTDVRDCCAPARCCVSCSCCQMPHCSCHGVPRAFDVIRLPSLPDSKLSVQMPCADADMGSIISNHHYRHVDLWVTALDHCVQLSRLTL